MSCFSLCTKKTAETLICMRFSNYEWQKAKEHVIYPGPVAPFSKNEWINVNFLQTRNDEDEDLLSSTRSMECCAICLDSILIRKGEKEMITLLSCNHVFCTKCIQEWEKYNQTCPTCREPIKSPNGVSTRTAVPAQEQYTQHQGGDREEQRQEGEKCLGNVVFFFFFWLHVYIVLLPLTLENTVELDHLPYFSLLVAIRFCFDKRIRN